MAIRDNLGGGSSGAVLDTLEEIAANTESGKAAGALAVKELNDSLVASDNLKFQFATDGEGNYGYLGADDSFIPFKSGVKLEKIQITNITTTNTLANESKLERLYDGYSSFNPTPSTEMCYAINTNTIKLGVTVDKPFKLAFVRTPHYIAGGVGNPIRFTIGDYTSPTMTRVANQWTTIPYVDCDNCEYLSLGTSFNIDLYGGSTHTGAVELEFYGFYE